MLELLRDLWGLVVAVLGSAWDLLSASLDLVLMEDPFWRGVECAVAAALVYRHRKALIRAVDRIPLVGAASAWVLDRADMGVDWVEAHVARVWEVVRSQTWDRLIDLVERAESRLRK